MLNKSEFNIARLNLSGENFPRFQIGGGFGCFILVWTFVRYFVKVHFESKEKEKITLFDMAFII